MNSPIWTWVRLVWSLIATNESIWPKLSGSIFSSMSFSHFFLTFDRSNGPYSPFRPRIPYSNGKTAGSRVQTNVDWHFFQLKGPRVRRATPKQHIDPPFWASSPMAFFVVPDLSFLIQVRWCLLSLKLKLLKSWFWGLKPSVDYKNTLLRNHVTVDRGALHIHDPFTEVSRHNLNLFIGQIQEVSGIISNFIVSIFFEAYRYMS